MTEADHALAQAALTGARQALDRAAHLLRLAKDSGRAETLLAARLSDGMFDTRGQMRTALGFTLRATLPLAGQPVPALPEELPDRLSAATAIISALTEKDFGGAAARRICHRAGFADLDQTTADYLHRFALPNLWFHLGMAYAGLRAHGLPLGKADWDGLHHYPAGFRWD